MDTRYGVDKASWSRLVHQQTRSNMALLPHYVLTQYSEDDGITGCVGVFTTLARAKAVMAKLKAENDGYSYVIDCCYLDPPDAEIFDA